jgi:hypothetical protein
VKIIFTIKDGMRCHDCTDYFLSVKKGDRVSIINRASTKTLAKKDDTIGWVLNEKLRDESKSCGADATWIK